jgi:LacI family transcriptional regulator
VKHARRAGGWYFAHDSGHNPVLSEKDLAGWRGDGVLTLIPHHPEILRLAESGLPVVSMPFAQSDLASHQVLVDRYLCGALGAEHLLHQGLDNFALLFETQTPSSDLDTGFSDALGGAGHTAVVGRIPRACRTPATAAAWCAQWLSALEHPVGVLAASGSLGCELITISQRRLGLHVPSDITILGVTAETLLGDSLPIGLSRVVVDLETVGYEAGRMLDQLMQGQHPEHNILRIPPPRVVLRESTDRQHLQDHEVNRALQYIRLHADRPIRVADVVNSVRISRSTLKVRFRRERNRTIREEILRAHLERAMFLLRTTDLSISRIAADSGFVQPSRLSEAFRRETGLTPKAYRLAARESGS